VAPQILQNLWTAVLRDQVSEYAGKESQNWNRTE